MLKYGDGSLAGSGLAEVAEGLAYPIGNYMTGQQYGVNHSFLGLTGRNVWAESAETRNFHLATTNFIPRGMFYDLFDSPSFPANVGSSFENILGGVDPVQGISFEEQYDALNPAVRSIAQFKSVLLQINPPSSSAADIETIFSAYGH